MSVDFLYILFFCLMKTVVLVSGKCVYARVCKRDGTLFHPCVYDGPAIKLKNESVLPFLAKSCPYLMDTYEQEGLCCDEEQIEWMKGEMSALGTVFKRCPSCQFNLAALLCYGVCSPNQSDFIQLTSFKINEDTLEKYVDGLNIYMKPEVAQRMYDACSQVILPSLGRRAIETVCGKYASHCTQERWFEYFGDPVANPYAPYKSSYILKNEDYLNYKPLEAQTFLCSESINNISSACSCMDCDLSCPALPQYPDTEGVFQIFGIDGFILIMSAIYILFATVFIILKLYFSIRRRNLKDDNYDEDDVEPKLNFIHRASNKMDESLENFFYFWGKTIANHPTLVIALASWFAAILIYGAQFLQITTDPVDIWVSPSSRSKIEKDYFEEQFEPFFRTEQIFLKSVGLPNITHETSNGMLNFGPVFNKEFLLEVYNLQRQIEEIPGLVDICFAPLSTQAAVKNLTLCTIQSVWGYFQNSLTTFNHEHKDEYNFTVNYLDHLDSCLHNSLSVECLAPYGGNVEAAIAVGSFSQFGDTAYDQAEALSLTYIIRNHLDPEKLKPALEWETKFIDLMKNYTKNKKSFMEIGFRSERSIEDELQRESVGEISTIAISYLLMFLYISIFLGSYRSFRTVMVDSKIALGLGGVLVVLLAVFCSLGMFGYIGLPSTLLTIEVIPFLVLAIGVDNMFLLVKTQKKNIIQEKDTDECIGQTLKQICPSLLLTTISEACCFAIGSLSNMPAVRTFALYATVALLLNFFLQMTVFVAFMTLNSRRSLDNRFDLFCCLKLESNSIMNSSEESRAYEFFKNYIISFMFDPFVKAIVFLLFLFWFAASLATIPHIEAGLEQQLAIPLDSYMTPYFEMLKDVLSMGPPVYFVVKSGLNYSEASVQNLICGGLRCSPDSLNTQISIASKQKNKTYIANTAASWLDDFNDWATVEGCCKMHQNGTFCPHSNQNCLICNITLNEDETRPDEASFRKFLPFFLQDNPDPSCAKGGHAAYNQAVIYYYDNNGASVVTDSYFMAYHKTLITSKDYYMALKMAREISQNITDTINSARPDGPRIEVFPYSIFYVFYEQYLTIWMDGTISILLSLAVVFIVNFLFNGFNVILAGLVLMTVSMIMTSIAALMYWWDINLNAVTLVNLVMAIGISVEFCSHIAHAFSLSEFNTKDERAKDALLNTGSSVLSGITLTKIIGIIVLAFSKTQVFRVFYFRMYLGMVVFGALHGLIFLPIFLSYFGPKNKTRIYLKKRRNLGYSQE